MAAATLDAHHGLQRAAAVAVPLKREAQAVDWSTVDYSGVDWGAIDWATVKYAGAIPAPPATTASVGQTTMPAAPVPTYAPPPVPLNDVTIPTGTNNTVTVINRGSQTCTVAFFANEGDNNPSFSAEQTLTLATGASRTVAFAQGWSGRVQKLTAGAGEPATWGEFTFNAYENQVYLDVSYIRGNNGAMTIGTANSVLAGTAEDLLDEAPADLKTVDSNGNTVLPATEGFDGSIDVALVSWYDQHGDGDGYVRDPQSDEVKSSADSNLVVAIY